MKILELRSYVISPLPMQMLAANGIMEYHRAPVTARRPMTLETFSKMQGHVCKQWVYICEITRVMCAELCSDGCVASVDGSGAWSEVNRLEPCSIYVWFSPCCVLNRMIMTISQPRACWLFWNLSSRSYSGLLAETMLWMRDLNTEIVHRRMAQQIREKLTLEDSDTREEMHISFAFFLARFTVKFKLVPFFVVFCVKRNLKRHQHLMQGASFFPFWATQVALQRITELEHVSEKENAVRLTVPPPVTAFIKLQLLVSVPIRLYPISASNSPLFVCTIAHNHY